MARRRRRKLTVAPRSADEVRKMACEVVRVSLPAPLVQAPADGFRWVAPKPVKVRYERRPLAYHAPAHPRNDEELPNDILAKLLRIQDCRCYLCREPFALDDAPTKDHVVPKAAGGARASGNILLACAECNNRKGDRQPYACELLYLQSVKVLFAASC